MKSEVLDILILGLLVVLFASFYRKRASAHLRCWVIGWILVVVHSAALLLPATTGRGLALVDSLSVSALLLSGLCFLFSASVILEAPVGRALAGAGIGIPALFYINYGIFAGSPKWPLYAAAVAATAAGVALPWRLCPTRRRVRTVITLTFLAGGVWSWVCIAQNRPTQGIPAFLFEIFLTFAALYWFDHRRSSTGVLTSILGLIAWAAAFPVGLLCQRLIVAGRISPELWNVPGYFVAFGMILTLLEDEFIAAGRAIEHYRLLFATSPYPMLVHDPETLLILEVNDAAVSQYGYSREEFERMALPDLRPAEDVAAILQENSVASSSQVTGPLRHRRKDGSSIQVEMSSHFIGVQGRKRTFVLVQDVTDRQQVHEQLVHQAHHDLLTGLPNRLLLEDRMRQSLAQAARYGQQAAVLCLDLDRFKEINDTLGHAAGDLCLQQVVRRVSSRLRAVDTFARIGGDEFVIVLGELSNRNSAPLVARSILESINKPIEVNHFSFDLGASIGISIYPDDGTDPSQLRRLADAAMYRAKQAGGGKYLLVSSQGNSAAEIGELEECLRSALKNGGLELYYQPQYSMTGSLCGLEAQLRLKHPKLGLLTADRFLPLAEECGLIVPLGTWVLDEVCRQMVEWQNQRLTPLRVSFSVSPLQLLEADFSTRVLNAASQRGLDPKLLELVVTESTVMRNRPEFASQLRSLAALGVHISVADFGSSSSCLSHLHQLPVSTLKIDCSFVERITDPNGTYTIVQAIVALAHSLGLKVVAEGVERADQMECLRTLGCDFVQGPVLAVALPAASIPKYLSSAVPPAAKQSRR